MANSLNDALNRIKNMANQGYADDNDSTSLTGAMSRILGDKYTDYQYKKAKDIYKQNESELNSYRSQRENLYKENTTPILNNQMNMPKYDSSIKLPTAGTNVAVETAKPIYEELNKASELPEIKKVQQNIKDTYKETAVSYDNYLNSKLANDDIGFIDKTLGPVISGVGSILPSKYKLENEQGQQYSMQNYSERKQQKILDSYNTKLGRILGSAAYELGKIGATTVVNAIGTAAGLPGIGTAAYFTDIFSDTYNRTLEKGYNKDDSLLYATINTASEAIVGKLIGGTSKALGMGSSELSSSLSSKLTEKILANHPRVANAIASAISEGNEEFVQEFLDKFVSSALLDKNNAKTALKDTFSVDTLADAIYSGVVGSLTGAVSGSMNKNYYNKVKVKDKNGKVHTEIIESSTNFNGNSMNDNVNVINGQNVDTDVKEEKPNIDSNINNDVQKNTNIDNKVNSDIYNNVVENTSISNSLINTTNDSKTAFKYMPTNDSKVNNLYQSASTSNFNNSPETIQLIDTATKLVKEKGYNILFDRTITNDNGESVNAKITTNPNNEVEIRINPDSKSAGEFLMVHEVSHAIKNNEMIELINDFASRNEKFAESVKEIETKYGKNLTSEEVFADVCGQLFGNEEFIHSLETKNTVESKNIIKQVYELLKHLLNKLTSDGRYRNFVQDLETKWRNAYRNTTMQKAISNLNNDTKFSIQTDINGKKYVNVDTNQDIFTGKSLAEQTKIAKKYILDNFRQNGIDVNNEKINVTSKTANEYTHPKNQLPSATKTSKMKASTELNNLLSISEYKYSKPDDGRHPLAKDGWDYYETTFKVGDNLFTGLVNIGKNGNKKTLYDITNIKRIDQNRGTSANAFSTSLVNSSIDNVPQSNTNVNTSSTKYSMQLNENNTQELDNSSFSLEQRVSGNELLDAQDLIEEIKSVGAIVDKNGYVTLYHQTTSENAEKIKQSGKMFAKEPYVYFSTSENASQSDGRGNTKLKFKIPVEKLELDDIFNDNADVKIKLNGSKELDVSNYIVNEELEKKSSSQGKNTKYSKNNSKWQEFLEDNFKSTGTRTYFKDVVLKNNEVSKPSTKYSENLNSNKSNDVLKVIIDNKTQKKLDQLDTELKNIKERYTKMYPNDKKQRDSKIKARAMEISAQKRNLIQGDWLIPIEKGLTSNELNNKINRLKSNYVGKEVIVDNNKGKVIGTSFGKIGVEFENGNTKYYDAADIKPIQNIDSIIKEQKEKYNQLITENKVDTTKKLNPIEISNLTENDATTTPKLSKTEDSKVGKGESHYWGNINEKTNMLSDDTKKAILSRDDIKYYKQITNKDSLNEAFDKLNKSGASETFRWSNIDSKTATATDVAEGWILLKQYNDTGDYDSAIVVAKKMKEMGTSAGQTVQAFNIMERMTPEGMVKYAQSELTDAYNIMVKNKTKEWIDKYKNDFDLQPNEVKFIVDTMKEVQNMEDGYSKKVKLAEIQKMMTDKLPPDKNSRLKSWMRISMLFNPKTQVRNVVGNALIMPVNSISDVISSKVDKIIAKKSGVRTTGTTDIKALLKGIKKGAYEATNDYKKGINTKDMDGNRFEISNQKSFSEKNLIGKSLNRTEALLNYVMDVGDRVFSEAAFENSLQNQMVLNNTTEVTQEMIDIAHTEALQRTWNDNNNYTKFVLDVRRGLNKIKVAGYGLGDVLIPFAKTPANLTKAIVDYSPAGLVSTITKGINLKNSLSNGQYTAKMQHQFVQSLGKATAGTMLYVLGIALAKAGITSGESDDDKDTRDFIKNALGISSYSIKIGDKSFTYDWAQPIAAPLSITANVVNSKKNKETALSEAIIGSLDTAGSILLEQSFLSSLNDVLSDNNGVASGIVNEVLELPSRAIPTFAKQIADLVDDTQRQTYEYDSPIKTAKNKIIAKLPGVSKTLSPSVDTMGREIKKYGGKSNIFNVFLNPANVNTKNISESAKEIYRLYKATGDQTIMPRVSPYYINQKNEKVILTTEQRANYSKVSGQIIEDNLKILLSNNNYQKLNDTEKSEIIKNIVDYSYNKARKDVVGIEMPNAYNGVKTYTMANGQISDYYLTKKAVSDIKDKYKDDTTTMKNARKQEIFSYINKLNINKAEKTMLFGITTNYSIKNYRTYLFNYINKLNITKKEKEEIWKDLYGKD